MDINQKNKLHNLKNDTNQEKCKIIFEYLKEKCHAKSIKYLNNREHFTSCDVNLECMDLKCKFNHYCFHLYPNIKKY